MQIAILIAALLISWLLFTALLKIIKTTVRTAVMVTAIFFAAQVLFGVQPIELWQEVTRLPETFMEFFQGGGTPPNRPPSAMP